MPLFYRAVFCPKFALAKAVIMCYNHYVIILPKGIDKNAVRYRDRKAGENAQNR